MTVRRDDGNIQHTASSHVCFPKSHGTTSKPASLESTTRIFFQHIPIIHDEQDYHSYLLCPCQTIEPGACNPEALEPYLEWVFACGDFIRQLRYQKPTQLDVGPCTDKSCHEPSCRCACDDPWQEFCIQERLRNTKVVWKLRAETVICYCGDKNTDNIRK